MATLLIFSGLKVVGVPQPKPLHGFSPNFQDMFTPRDLQLIRFWRVSGYHCFHGYTFKISGILNFVGVIQPKPLYGFSPNFQDMFTPRGSRAD